MIDDEKDEARANPLEFSGGRTVRVLAPDETARLGPCGVCVLDGVVVVDFRYPGHPGNFGQIALPAGFWADVPAGSEARAKGGARLLVLPAETG
jgi:hypothetical protein